MKIKAIILGLISTVVAGPLAAQDIESDDMYFNSKDRAKLVAFRKANNESALSGYERKVREIEKLDDEGSNPTDSYSARNVNPEYTSRSQSTTARTDNEDYFINNYRYGRYNTANNYNSWNNGFNSWYNNPWYYNNYYSPNIYGWNSPYYGSYYDSWGNPWNNPYYQPGWSSSFSYYWGSSWNYGWGNSGYCNSYASPWNAYYGGGSYWNSWNPYRSSYYGGGYYSYPPVVYVERGYRDRGVYGKRGSRSSYIVNDYDNTSNRANRGGSYSGSNGGSRSDGGGRVSNTRQSDYYNHSWRSETRTNTYSNDQQNSSNSNNSRSTNSGRTTSWSNDNDNSWRSNSSFDRSNNSNSNSSVTPSRSSGSGSRSSGNSSSGSGSRSSRGRDN
ncbi:MAG: hypothetical protein ACOYXT_12005 [Bacteroidota bacterium]